MQKKTIFRGALDIEHLDERRMAIGLPTREMNEKRDKILMQWNE
jgi:hypothetical protein